MKKETTKKIALCGILSAFACIAFMIENLFPPLFIPGAKLGLSNLFVLLALLMLGVKYAFFSLFAKVLVSCFFAGFASAMYSLPAGTLALTAEILLIYAVKTSLPCASVTGSVINVTVQNSIFCLIAGTPEYLVYLPYLATIAAITGFAVGTALFFTIKRLPEKNVQEDVN